MGEVERRQKKVGHEREWNGWARGVRLPPQQQTDLLHRRGRPPSAKGGREQLQ